MIKRSNPHICVKAIETPEEGGASRYFADHARQVKTNIESLGRKAYWERLPGSPDFVVAFLPLESLFSAALDHDPAILELGMRSRVVIATPTTLITLLLTVAHGWRQHSLTCAQICLAKSKFACHTISA